MYRHQSAGGPVPALGWLGTGSCCDALPSGGTGPIRSFQYALRGQRCWRRTAHLPCRHLAAQEVPGLQHNGDVPGVSQVLGGGQSRQPRPRDDHPQRPLWPRRRLQLCGYARQLHRVKRRCQPWKVELAAIRDVSGRQCGGWMAGKIPMTANGNLSHPQVWAGCQRPQPMHMAAWRVGLHLWRALPHQESHPCCRSPGEGSPRSGPADKQKPVLPFLQVQRIQTSPADLPRMQAPCMPGQQLCHGCWCPVQARRKICAGWTQTCRAERPDAAARPRHDVKGRNCRSCVLHAGVMQRGVLQVC